MTYLAFALCGALTGFLAGLLGIGGGLITVPFLFAMAPALGVDPAMLAHTVVATSLATMMPTTFAAAWSQRLRGALDVDWARRFIPGLSIGIGIVTVLAGRVSGREMTLAFVAYALWCGMHMLLGPGRKPVVAVAEMAAPPIERPTASVHAVATFVGASSAAAGLGGAFLVVPYLLRQGLPMRRVVATSSAISFVICTEGSIAYSVVAPAAGSGATVHVPWLFAFAIGLAAMLTAPLGVALAHRVPTIALRRLFGGVAIAAAVSALLSI